MNKIKRTFYYQRDEYFNIILGLNDYVLCIIEIEPFHHKHSLILVCFTLNFIILMQLVERHDHWNLDWRPE